MQREIMAQIRAFKQEAKCKQSYVTSSEKITLVMDAICHPLLKKKTVVLQQLLHDEDVPWQLLSL